MDYEEDPSTRYGGEEAEERERKAEEAEMRDFEYMHENKDSSKPALADLKMPFSHEELEKVLTSYFNQGKYEGIRIGYIYGKHSNPAGDKAMKKELEEILKAIPKEDRKFLNTKPIIEKQRKPSHEEPGHESPRMLPIIAFQGTSTKYYWDARLGQVRNINNPHDYWDPKRSARESIEYFVQEGKMTMPFKYKEE